MVSSSPYKNWKEAVVYLLILPIAALWIMVYMIRLLKNPQDQTERFETLEKRAESLENKVGK